MLSQDLDPLFDRQSGHRNFFAPTPVTATGSHRNCGGPLSPPEQRRSAAIPDVPLCRSRHPRAQGRHSDDQLGAASPTPRIAKTPPYTGVGRAPALAL